MVREYGIYQESSNYFFRRCDLLDDAHCVNDDIGLGEFYGFFNRRHFGNIDASDRSVHVENSKMRNLLEISPHCRLNLKVVAENLNELMTEHSASAKNHYFRHITTC